MSVSAWEAIQDVLLNASTLVIIAFALSTVYIASWRATLDVKPRSRDAGGDESYRRNESSTQEQAGGLSDRFAMALPFVAAAVLLTLFFFKEYAAPILLLLSIGVSAISLPYCLQPLCDVFFSRCRIGSGTKVVGSALAIGVVCAWLVSGHWMLNNVIAMSMCVFMVSVVRVPSLRVVSVLFVGLLVYDVLMVFVSPLLLQKNVMVEVATQESSNPVSSVSDAFHLDLPIAKKLPFPGKLVVPAFNADAEEGSFNLLGLGDCMIPALLFTYLRSVEIFTLDPERKRLLPYYTSSLVAYLCALVVTFWISIMYNAAQPALLYIVPITLVTAGICAVRNGEWELLWRGPADMVGEALFDFADPPVQAQGQVGSGSMI